MKGEQVFMWDLISINFPHGKSYMEEHPCLSYQDHHFPFLFGQGGLQENTPVGNTRFKKSMETSSTTADWKDPTRDAQEFPK